MELLAPAGSKEAFITAIRAGADAVYIGVPDFNARVSATGINHYDLRVMIDYAHGKGVKVFLALNTLIKHEEINDVVKSLTFIGQMRPDAVIVQDLGVANIIKNHFPDIPLHASTQLAVHNRPGVDFLARQGFERVILARELSFSELKIIAGGSPLPLEVFCHGALCFCLSGMCLFSSLIGGMSGNRGRCTQPCRRLWENGAKKGYLFSPRDLELAGHIDKLKKIGIASLKIEGRMRSSEYVYRTVKAYRLLIDAPAAGFRDALKEAEAILARDVAREKTTCLFSGRDAALFQPGKAQCLGNFFGRIDEIKDGNLYIVPAESTGEIVEKDRLRISDPASDTTISFKVRGLSKEGARYIIPFGKANEFSRGNPVFKTADVLFDQQDIEKDIDGMYKAFQEKNRGGRREELRYSQAYTSLISSKWKEFKNAVPPDPAQDTLWIRFDAIEWQDILPPPDKNNRHVLYLTKENMHLSDKIPAKDAPFFSGELPPFIGQRDVPQFAQRVNGMIAAGITKWVINNVAQFEFFRGTACELTAGPFLYTWNAYTAAFLADNGVTRFTVSWEDDLPDIKKMCGPGLGSHVVCYLYGFVPMVRSRLITRDMLEDGMITNSMSDPDLREGRAPFSFFPVFESGLALLIPDKPVSLFTARDKLRECGIATFGIDLSYMKPDRKRWAAVFSAWQRREPLPDTRRFNFKRGIK